MSEIINGMHACGGPSRFLEALLSARRSQCGLSVHPNLPFILFAHLESARISRSTHGFFY